MKLCASLSDFIASNYDLARLSSRELLRIRLIHLISLVFIGLTPLMFATNYFLGLNQVNTIIMTCDIIGVINLYLLFKTQKIILSSHLIMLVVLIGILAINVITGGLNTSYFLWVFIIPVMAAVLLNTRGLLIYSTICAMAMVSSYLLFAPSESINIALNQAELSLVNFVNHLFFIIILTAILYTLLHEKSYYEKTLEDHNVMLRSSENKYRFLAHHDELTNLPNRNYLQEKLKELIKQDRYRNRKVTIFFMDLDNLKHINDNYGHKTGDIVLLLVGRRLKQCFRSEDIIARVGGDEFIAITLENESDFSTMIAKRILTEIRRPFRCDNHIIETSLSIGIATYPLNGNNISDVIEVADKMLYKVKAAGKNDFAIA